MPYLLNFDTLKIYAYVDALNVRPDKLVTNFNTTFCSWTFFCCRLFMLQMNCPSGSIPIGGPTFLSCILKRKFISEPCADAWDLQDTAGRYCVTRDVGYLKFLELNVQVRNCFCQSSLNGIPRNFGIFVRQLRSAYMESVRVLVREALRSALFFQ